ncbi:hypothetical protein [Williamsia sp.]|uniref:hypothetical protein n=1 Tax=Williamsia sp. TaxID=1872085 RepID=UPI001A223EFC|nr:hypothetical protein [Williamsia sp.]MBJ7288678.1 hypothetical protein [Williamsia sp.]
MSTRTGRSSVCRTLGQLVDAMLPTDAHRRAELTRALLDVAENAVIDSGNHIV